MNPFSGVAFGQLMQFPSGNSTVFAPGVGGTSRREEFCSCCQQHTQINGFFCILVLIFTAAGNSENQVKLPAGPVR